MRDYKNFAGQWEIVSSMTSSESIRFSGRPFDDVALALIAVLAGRPDYWAAGVSLAEAVQRTGRVDRVDQALIMALASEVTNTSSTEVVLRAFDPSVVGPLPIQLLTAGLERFAECYDQHIDSFDYPDEEGFWRCMAEP